MGIRKIELRGTVEGGGGKRRGDEQGGGEGGEVGKSISGISGRILSKE